MDFHARSDGQSTPRHVFLFRRTRLSARVIFLNSNSIEFEDDTATRILSSVRFCKYTTLADLSTTDANGKPLLGAPNGYVARFV